MEILSLNIGSMLLPTEDNELKCSCGYTKKLSKKINQNIMLMKKLKKMIVLLKKEKM